LKRDSTSQKCRRKKSEEEVRKGGGRGVKKRTTSKKDCAPMGEGTLDREKSRTGLGNKIKVN